MVYGVVVLCTLLYSLARGPFYTVRRVRRRDGDDDGGGGDENVS